MSDIYQAPSSELTEPAALEGFGSLEKGISGQFNFVIGDIMSEAWKLTNGNKGKLWLSLLLYLIVAMPIMIVVPLIVEMILPLPEVLIPGEMPSMDFFTAQIVTQLIVTGLTLPLGAGLFMVGLKVASGAAVSSTEVFSYFHKLLTLFFTVVLMYALIIIGLALLVLPGIYLMIAYYLAIPLIVEKNLSPWQALEASRKALSKCWFRFFGLGLILMVIMFVAMIPLGIGLIWVFSFMLIAYGIVYRNIFGLENITPA